MKSDKFSLKNIDDETADLIDREFPPELTPDDIDEIYRKSCEKFRRADLKTADSTEMIVESSPVEVIQPKRWFAFFSLNKVCAAACALLTVTAFYALTRHPDTDIAPPDDLDLPPTVTGENKVTSTSPHRSTAAETAPETKTSAVSTISTTAASTSEPSVETTVTQPPETTPPPETTTALTTTEPAAADRTNDPWGYFTIQEFEEYSYSKVRYVRTNTEPVEMLEHTANVELYSCEVLSEYPGASKVWELKTAEENPPIIFQELSYTYFTKQFNRQSEITFTEINGRPAVLSHSGSYCLVWDDGCHVCSLTAYEVDYDFMFEFAKNYK